MPEYHNIFMALKIFDKLEVSTILNVNKSPEQSELRHHDLILFPNIDAMF